MSKNLLYLRYVLKHKWFVFWACLELDVPVFQALIHDWHKFLPDEWYAYRQRIQYGGFMTYDSKVKQKVSVLPNIHEYPTGNQTHSNERGKCHHVSTLLLPDLRDLRMQVWRHLNLEIYKADATDNEVKI